MKEETYWHNLPPLAQTTLNRININHTTVQTAPGSLHNPRDNENSCLLGNPLKFLPCTVSPIHLLFIHRQRPLHPRLPGTRRCIPQIDRGMEVFQELVSANGIPTADGAPKVAGARVSAEIGFWEKQQVDVSSGRMVSCGGEGG